MSDDPARGLVIVTTRTVATVGDMLRHRKASGSALLRVLLASARTERPRADDDEAY